ncbi:flagellar protein FliT [Paenibacillus athensensis]|uniref:Flagellar protein FliT n=1 Tax=Paenibacillus athensensis TaxID=1967502 RepID=A0A4Y8Q5B8_9BACL|nr:flagellar protein FliT [Paenibacillus athensensis]MCD1260824.1 flagellar protein FliT [Paenibacillus athensensis]
MDSLIQRLEELTRQGLEQLPNMDYEQLGEFMESRAAIINSIASVSLTTAQQALYRGRIQEVLRQDPIFKAKMEALRSEAREQLQKFETSRTQRNAYDHAYDGESFFFDKKK